MSDMATHSERVQRRRRQLRERIRALTFGPLMRGSVVEIRRRCGKKHCACFANPDARHTATCLSVNIAGRTEFVYLRPEDEEAVRTATAAYKELWEMIDGLTICELADLKRQARERRRSRQRRRQ
jgi:hypothetical protein